VSLLNRETKTRLAVRAYHRALRELRDRHRAEFDHIHSRKREEVGLYRDGVDVEVASAALEEDEAAKADRISRGMARRWAMERAP
jgi:hypothetical protein